MDGDVTPSEIETITVAEVIDDKLMPAGEVQFGVGRRLREALEAYGSTQAGKAQSAGAAGADRRNKVFRPSPSRQQPSSQEHCP